MSRTKQQRRQRVCDHLKKRLPASSEVLEVSCGNGEILEMLQRVGYAVRGTNFSRYPDAIRSIEIDSGVDLRQGLPYEDGSYDCALAVDVIEHVSDSEQFVKELSRVVRRDGYVIILTPNIMKISSRIGFVLTGFHKTKREFIGFDVPAEKSFAFHNYPVHLPTLLYLSHAYGLETTCVDAVRFKKKAFLFWLLFIPVILPATWLKTYIGEANIRRSGASVLLCRSLLSFKTLCGESLILVCRKTGCGAETGGVRTPLPEWSETPRRDPAP